MDKEEIISGLQDLIIDRESFITNDSDDIFKKDKEVLEQAIYFIENSIPKTVVEEKIKRKKEERKKYWIKDDIMLNFMPDKKEAKISIKELEISGKSREMHGEIKALQELLQTKENDIK